MSEAHTKNRQEDLSRGVLFTTLTSGTLQYTHLCFAIQQWGVRRHTHTHTRKRAHTQTEQLKGDVQSV